MFYDAIKNTHGLPHDPIKALVAPRPIAWITSLDMEGRVNLAPYSFFNMAGNGPNYVMFSPGSYKGQAKDTWRNIEATKEFVVNMVGWDQRMEMNQSSYPYSVDVDELAHVGLEPVASEKVAPPRVKGVPAALECSHFQTVTLPNEEGQPSGSVIIIGKVLGVYIDDQFITNGMVDTAKMRLLSRLGYMDYCVTDEVFQIGRPERP